MALRRPRGFERAEPGPVWDIRRDGVTQSLIKSFLTCREQTRLRYVEGWRALGESPAIAFGNYVHFVLSHMYGGEWGARTLADARERHTLLWRMNVGQPTMTQQAEASKNWDLADRVLRVYFRHWAKQDDGRDWSGLESVFTVFEDRSAVAPLKLTGKFDGVFRDGEDTWLFETKTKSQISPAEVEELLPSDFQTWFYLFALLRLNGTAPAGVEYNIIRRPALKLGKKDELRPDLFLERVYNDVFTRPEFYFYRWRMDVTRAEIEDWAERQLSPILLDLWNWANGTLPHYMNPDALTGRYGRSDLYDLIVRQNRLPYYRARLPFSELVELEAV